MKLLFIQGGSRVKIDRSGNFYTDGNLTNNIWDRYKFFTDSLTVILRKEKKVYDDNFAKRTFCNFDTSSIKYYPVDDIYRPKINYFNFIKRKQIKKIIKKSVLENNFVIIRSVTSVYCQIALKYCKKYRKKYLIEVTGFAFEGTWYHSFLGKFLAEYREYLTKKSIKKADYAVYVTKEALQKRYPCKGEQLGCSDVELDTNPLSIADVENKSTNINSLKLGTAAFLDVNWKGQKDVILALSELYKMGIDSFTYHLLGIGEGRKLKKLVKKLHLENVVFFDGSKPHSDIFAWYKSLDVYIQPSYQEGLCRSIVEAMSCGLPVICTNIGGNYELIDQSFMYRKKRVKELTKLLKDLTEIELRKSALCNFKKSSLYNKNTLNQIRNEFYIKAIKNFNA